MFELIQFYIRTPWIRILNMYTSGNFCIHYSLWEAFPVCFPGHSGVRIAQGDGEKPENKLIYNTSGYIYQQEQWMAFWMKWMTPEEQIRCRERMTAINTNEYIQKKKIQQMVLNPQDHLVIYEREHQNQWVTWATRSLLEQHRRLRKEQWGTVALRASPGSTPSD